MSCSYCFGTGTVMARLKDSDIYTPYAFVCSCSRARRRSFPVWDNGLLKEYDVLEQQTPDFSGPRRPIRPLLQGMPK